MNMSATCSRLVLVCSCCIALAGFFVSCASTSGVKPGDQSRAQTRARGRPVQWRTAVKPINVRGMSCKPPAAPLHAVYHWDDISSTLTYRCRPGLILHGSARSVCLGGQWSSAPPVCLGLNCVKPRHFQYGTTVISHGGALLHFRCRRGFQLRGTSSTMACIDGHWNGTHPECVRTQSKQAVRSAATTDTNVPSDNTGKSAADIQHIAPARSTASRKAKDDGGGRHQQPLQLSNPSVHASNIRRRHEDWLDEADYSCVQSAAAFTVPPPTVSHAYYVTRWTIWEGLPRLYAVYRCGQGHVMETAEKTENMYCRRGGWVGVLPVCIRFNGIKDQGSHATLDLNRLLARADYSCVDWNEGSGVLPPDIDGSKWSYQTMIIDGSTRLFVKYECKEGLVMTDSQHSVLFCQNGQWTGIRPHCTNDNGGTSCLLDRGGCEHECTVADAKNGAVTSCQCRIGYDLNDDRRTCRDLDECEVNNGNCQHLCDNTDGSYQCSCYPGFQLQADKRKCQLQDEVVNNITATSK